MRLGYKDLGFKLFEPLTYWPHWPQKLDMEEEKRDEGVGYPINLLFKEALVQQRNEMMDKFAQILRWLPTCDTTSSSGHFRGATPFKVQVIFDIPLFEGQIYVDVVDK